MSDNKFQGDLGCKLPARGEPIVPPGYKLAEPGDIVIDGKPVDVVALWNERNTLRAALDAANARVLELEQELHDAHDRADTNAIRVQRVMDGGDAAFIAGYGFGWDDGFHNHPAKEAERLAAYKAGLKGEGRGG